MRKGSLSLLLFVTLCAVIIQINADKDEVPLTKLRAKTGPRLKFFYCYSCGYRKVYEEYVGILRKKYPELQIDGENFNPPGYNMLIAKILGTARILIIVLIISGINIFQRLGQPEPSLWRWCIDNRFYACVMIFFICNAIEGQLISSGAFEIHFNDVPVWSKLETGRIPQPPELFQIIESHLHMQFLDTDVGKIGFNK
ncbi:thioredoxin reductase-like selenoprotein T homolog CG3887 [Vespa crabro]|uniref:thioredoxin reductase-like selenoprotein T homolog CG3887 n=1 Tax=Vespa crabro TaxID=7445 RepID=UPI001F02C1F5|nr:thioredoxin reductase-like selenoprotein T homolog CG3887 [Vespa crabro]